jgi:flagellar biosynthesis/type III secretory pathway M-ring protein FliF/YscJ
MLLAGTVTCIISLIKSFNMTYTLELLLGVLVVFYIIGLIARKLINNIITTDLEVNDGMDVATEENENAEAERKSASETKTEQVI